jgi:hypothetical protein
MNITKIYLTIALSLVSFLSKAQERTDTVQANPLDEVVVEARNQRLGAEVSTYIPTEKQNNASQTAADLLNRMAIPN